MKYKKSNFYSTATVPKLAAPCFSPRHPLFSSLLYDLLFIAVINDVRLKIKANYVGFSAGPFIVFVATLLFYVMT